MRELLARGVINFGMSLSDAGSLTIVEYKIFAKVHKDKVKTETELQRNAVLNAIGNVLKKKNDPFMDMFPEEKEEKAPRTEEETASLREELFKGRPLFGE